MPTRVLQEGSGAVRPLVVVYHYSNRLDSRLLCAAGPRAMVVNHTAPVAAGAATTGGAYAKVGSGGLEKLASLAARLGKQVKCDFGPVVLAGFSEGCQALRAQLLAGEAPGAIVAIDGIHASLPPTPNQIDPWKRWMEASKFLGGGLWYVTHSQIDPPKVLSVRKTLEVITDATIPPVETVQTTFRSGGARVVSYPGADAAAHTRQAVQVLPAQVTAALRTLGVSDAGAEPCTSLVHVPAKPPVAPAKPAPVVTVTPPASPLARALGWAVALATVGGAAWLAARDQGWTWTSNPIADLFAPPAGLSS